MMRKAFHPADSSDQSIESVESVGNSAAEKQSSVGKKGASQAPHSSRRNDLQRSTLSYSEAGKHRARDYHLEVVEKVESNSSIVLGANKEELVNKQSTKRRKVDGTHLSASFQSKKARNLGRSLDNKPTSNHRNEWSDSTKLFSRRERGVPEAESPSSNSTEVTSYNNRTKSRAFTSAEDSSSLLHSSTNSPSLEKQRQNAYKMAAMASLEAYYDRQKQEQEALPVMGGKSDAEEGYDDDESAINQSTTRQHSNARKKSDRFMVNKEDVSIPRCAATGSGKSVSPHLELSSLPNSKYEFRSREESSDSDENSEPYPRKKASLVKEKCPLSKKVHDIVDERSGVFSDRFGKSVTSNDQAWGGRAPRALRHATTVSTKNSNAVAQLLTQASESSSNLYLQHPEIIKNTDLIQQLHQGVQGPLSALGMQGTSSPGPAGCLLDFGYPSVSAPFSGMLPSLTSEQVLRSLASGGASPVGSVVSAADLAILAAGTPPSYPLSLQQFAQLQNAAFARRHALSLDSDRNNSLTQVSFPSSVESKPVIARSSSTDDRHDAVKRGILEAERPSLFRDARRRGALAGEMLSSNAGNVNVKSRHCDESAPNANSRAKTNKSGQQYPSDFCSAKDSNRGMIAKNPLDDCDTGSLRRAPPHNVITGSHFPTSVLATFAGRELIPPTSTISQLLVLPGGRIGIDSAFGTPYSPALGPFLSQLPPIDFGARVLDSSLGDRQHSDTFGRASSNNALHDAFRIQKHEANRSGFDERFAGSKNFGNAFLGNDPTQQATIDCSGIPLKLPILLGRPDDKHKLSSHQVLLRYQIEAFQASHDDISTHTRGRNRPITLGQVGIRCKHCAHLPVAARQKGSTYFPATLLGLYQAAQNMSTTHMQGGVCNDMPAEIKEQFAAIMSTAIGSSGAGRPYWARSARELGLVDTEEHGIRFIRDLPPSMKRSDGFSF